MKKIDLVNLATGALAVGTVLLITKEHVYRTEKSRGWRIFKTIGLCAGAFAIGGFMATSIVTENKVSDLYDIKRELDEFNEEA